MKIVGKTVRLATFALLAAVLGTAAAQGQTNAYVASSGNTRVLQLDTLSQTATATVTGTGSRHLSFSRNGALLYSVSFNAVQVVNVATIRWSPT